MEIRYTKKPVTIDNSINGHYVILPVDDMTTETKISTKCATVHNALLQRFLDNA